jgi:hypothetical protein
MLVFRLMLIGVLLNRLVLSRSVRMLAVLIDHSNSFKKCIADMQILPIMSNLSALILTTLIGVLMVWIVLSWSVLVLIVPIVKMLTGRLAPNLDVPIVLTRGVEPFLAGASRLS